MADTPTTPPLFRKLLVAAIAAAVLAAGTFLYTRSLDTAIDDCHGWVEVLRSARFMVPSQPPFPDHDALKGTLHSLEVALPEIEAAEVTRLTTVRDCTEAALKVVNTSMNDSPRRHLREEALGELAATLDALIPAVEAGAAAGAGGGSMVTWVMLALGLLTVGLAVGCLVVGIRAKK